MDSVRFIMPGEAEKLQETLRNCKILRSTSKEVVGFYLYDPTKDKVFVFSQKSGSEVNEEPNYVIKCIGKLSDQVHLYARRIDDQVEHLYHYSRILKAYERMQVMTERQSVDKVMMYTEKFSFVQKKDLIRKILETI